MSGRRRVFTDEQLERIVQLLSTTDMTIPSIAERMGCSRSTVSSINRRLRIREYAGRRATWIPLQEELSAANS